MADSRLVIGFLISKACQNEDQFTPAERYSAHLLEVHVCPPWKYLGFHSETLD